MEVKHEAFIPFNELQEIIERHLNSQGYRSIPNSIVGLVSGDNGGCTVMVQPIPQPAPKPEPSVFEKAQAYLGEQKAKPVKVPAPKQDSAEAIPPLPDKNLSIAEKNRIYAQRNYARKKAEEHANSTPRADRVEARNQVVKERVAELKQGLTLDVEPEQKWPAMPVKTAEHVHDWKYYPMVSFTDPTDPNHKHIRRMCRTCGEHNEVGCKTCQVRKDDAAFAQKVKADIEEIREVVAPSPATFPSTSTTEGVTAAR